MREAEIPGFIAKGPDSLDISERLFISANTVNIHRHNIPGKTSSENTTQVLFYSRRIGIV